MKSPESDRLTLAGLDLGPKTDTFPFMPGAGAINGAGEENLIRDFESFVYAPGAVAMIGSITVEPRQGNEAQFGGPVFMHFDKTGFTYNSMGLPNVGIDSLIKLIPKIKQLAEANGKVLALSLAPVTKNPAKEWIKMGELLLGAGVKIIEFNAGCPNVFDEDGKPKAVLSHEPDFMGEELEKVNEVLGDDFVAGVKISPAPTKKFGPDYNLDEQSERLIAQQAGVINRLGYSKLYVAYFNTFGGQVPVDETGTQRPLSVAGGAGGVSGSGVADVAKKQTELLLWYMDQGKDVVVAGGIATGRDIKDRLAMDPRIKLASVVTPLWQAKSIGDGALRLAEEYAESIG